MNLSAALFIPIVLSVILIVFSLGARTTLDDVLYLYRHPVQLARAGLTIYVIVPAAAMLLALAFPLSIHTKLVLIALAVSPIPPILPVKQVEAGAEDRYAISLLTSASALALILTPLLLSSASNLLGGDARVAARDIALPLLVSTEIPLAAGMLFRWLAPHRAEAAHAYARKAGIALLLAGAGAIFVFKLPAILALIGDGTVFAMAGMVLVGLFAGHLLGGPDHRNSAALALAAATRHPGVALAIVATNIPDQQQAALAACLLFFAINLALTFPYTRWIRRRMEAAPDRGP